MISTPKASSFSQSDVAPDHSQANKALSRSNWRWHLLACEKNSASVGWSGASKWFCGMVGKIFERKKYSQRTCHLDSSYSAISATVSPRTKFNLVPPREVQVFIGQLEKSGVNELYHLFDGSYIHPRYTNCKAKKCLQRILQWVVVVQM